jgi:Glycosyl hydrolases family 16
VVEFRDDFETGALDGSVWFPHYLPAWSSRDRTRATYEVADSQLRLFIPPGAGLWCEDEHPEPLRVSGIQSGSWSGPVGSTAGQQRFRDGQLVREEQPRLEGWLPSFGRVAIRCRMDLTPRSMAAMWLSGFEEEPDEAGEICVVEVFGRGVRAGESAEVGVGVKQVNDPRLVHDFAAPRLDLGVAEPHTYAVEWDAGRASFLVDGTEVRSCAGPPTYPLQVMIAVFDFPGWSEGGDDELVPSLVVDWVAGGPLSRARQAFGH